MRTTLCFAGLLALSFVTMTQIRAQEDAEEDSTGLPGDNFSLQGALDMFKTAGSPEEFEKALNTSDNHINNLDLNGDGDIDYIRVIDRADKGIHVFVLQVPISETENQDIAVIELEKNGDSSAIVQIIGDKDIYGEQTIIEPSEGSEGELEGGEEKGPHVDLAATMRPVVVVNVWGWPCVRYIYRPAYVAWASPWGWRRYPGWWRPWRPLAWRAFHPFRLRYHPGFAIVGTHRIIRARRIYGPVRASSVMVRTRHHASVTHYRARRTTTIRATTRGGTKVKGTRTTTRTRTRTGRGRR